MLQIILSTESRQFTDKTTHRHGFSDNSPTDSETTHRHFMRQFTDTFVRC